MKTGFIVKQPGLLSLIQDLGRFGHHRIGLTNGGPMDPLAFQWANRLCGNTLEQAAIEVTVGGLQLEAGVDTTIAITGADVCLKINTIEKELWRTHTVKQGDLIELGFAKKGCRSYLAVAGGFQVPRSFSSVATVCREQVGGLNGGKLVADDFLPCNNVTDSQAATQHYQLAVCDRPTYQTTVSLRTIVGYQHQHFDSIQQRLFFTSEYKVSSLSDRMGYRLQGPAISADIDGILSEGICQGAIQIPADGQPIVLMNDRQTIGGYPKIGSVIAVDTGLLAQLSSGQRVSFTKVSIEEAHNLAHLSAQKFQTTQLQRL